LSTSVIPADAGIQGELGPGVRRDDGMCHSERTLEKCYRCTDNYRHY
jgi:hypothetical protein